MLNVSFKAAALSEWSSDLQLGQRTRTKRWARTPSNDEATRYGSTPMSTRRVRALGASFVCSVEKTRWPVSEACTAMRAVSWSRISPIRTTSGSCRRIERSPTEKVSPVFSETWIWLMPLTWYSMGSSTVTILRIMSLISLRAV